jgi:ornithine cyclodeaminase/alanine dehydrogenase-like protein (mu-crystallin family)
LRRIKTAATFGAELKECDGEDNHAAKLIDAEFLPVNSASEVMRGADVVICATNSNVPVFDGA